MGRPVRVALVSALALAAIVALVVFGLASTKKNGKRAPALPRERLAGADVTLPSLLAGARGRPVAVVFWASWCGPCSREAPALQRFAEGEGRDRIVGVDWSDARANALGFVHRFGWTFPNVRDGEGTVGNEYDLSGLPTTFVLDGEGRIRETLRGPQDERTLAQAFARAQG